MARAVATQQQLRLALLLLPAVLSQDDDAGGEGGDEPAGPLSIQSSATAADENAAVCSCRRVSFLLALLERRAA